jgi:hypothetical protein
VASKSELLSSHERGSTRSAPKVMSVYRFSQLLVDNILVCLRMYVLCHHKLMVWCALLHMSLNHYVESLEEVSTGR